MKALKIQIDEFTPVVNSPATHRDNNLSFLRFVLASLVVFTHCFPLADGSTLKHPYGDTEREWLYAWSNGQLFGGSLAVYLFFILSGFLITESLKNSPTIKVFLLKRVLRIYPAFLATTIIGSLLASLSIGWDVFYQDLKLLDFFQSIFLLQFPEIPKTFLNNPYAGEENGSLWTIKYEAAMYLLLAGLGLLNLIQKRIYVLLACLGFYAIYVSKLMGSPWFWKISEIEIYPFGTLTDFPAFLTYFFIGSTFYLYREYLIFNKKLVFVSSLVIILSMQKYLEMVLPFFGGYLLLYFGLKSTKNLRFANETDLSYGVYLNSFLIQQSLLQLFPEIFTRSPYTLFLATYPLSLIIAYISWTYLEKRFLELKKLM